MIDHQNQLPSPSNDKRGNVLGGARSDNFLANSSGNKVALVRLYPNVTGELKVPLKAKEAFATTHQPWRMGRIGQSLYQSFNIW